MAHKITIGVFVPNDAQLLDLACVDVLGMMSREYLAAAGLPAEVVAQAPSVAVRYITTAAQKAAGAVPLTSGAVLVPTHALDDADVQPGRLDIVVVPGPDPRAVVDEAARAFLRAHAAVPSTDVLSVCTGLYVCGQAGLLAGPGRRRACGPRALVPDLAARYPDVELLGATHRWVQDGNFWSSGGVTNGNDLMAAYARANSHRFPPPVVAIACAMADVGDRAQVVEAST